MVSLPPEEGMGERDVSGLYWFGNHGLQVFREDLARYTGACPQSASSVFVPCTTKVRPTPAERERHACPTCGYSHWAVVEGEWKS